MTHVSPRRILLFLLIAAAATALALVVILRSTSTADAASSVGVRLSDFKVRATPSSTGHGRVTFRVRNAADMEHELIVIKTNRRADALPMRNGKASDGGAKGEVEVDGGESKRLTLNLSAGHYVLICNIGQHYQAGMRTNFTVR
jgi:uncharacterized cupredoxin-like copper-binding protein